MKIITHNAAYIQNNDILYLSHSDYPIPASIFLKIFGNGRIVINNSNKYDFFKFDDEDEIDFFKNVDWLIDYDEIKDLDEEKALSLGQRISQEKNEIVQTFDSLSEEEKKANMDMITECDLLDFKMYSLRDFLSFKQGDISMPLPEGINYPDGYKESKGLKRVLKRIKNHKKH